jgi:hypothetical protein
MELLLWIVAAAALGALGVWRVRRAGDRQRQLMNLCHRAGLGFEPIDPFHDLWLPFSIIGRGSDRGTENAVWDRRDGGHVRAFDLWIEEKTQSGARGRRRLWSCAVAELPFATSSLKVVPRSRVDTLMDRLEGGGIELELESFNRRFRVESDDRRFAVAFLDQRMMLALLGLPPHVSLEVREDRLLLTAPLLPAAEVLVMLEAARLLGRHVPKVVASMYPPRPMEGPFEDRWLQGHWSAEPTEASGSLVPPRDAG